MENQRLELLLGQILQRNGFITPEQLDAALTCQREGEALPIGKILTRLGALTPDQLLIGVMQQYALLSSAEIVE